MNHKDNKKDAIEQACEHLGFDTDDTMPVEVVEEDIQPIRNHNIVVLNAPDSVYRQLMKTFMETGSGVIWSYIQDLERDLGYADSEDGE